MEIQAIEKSYALWAPVYDKTFGAVTQAGRRRAVSYVNTRGGSVLEVGVGTGLALPLYGKGVEVTGVDYSEEMLEKARDKVKGRGLSQVRSLQQMDARELCFADDSFDNVVAMHIMSVVPEPRKVLAEMTRVCKPGGIVLITNHFARESGALATLERVFAPMANLIGWHSDFPISTVMGETGLALTERRALPPLGMMTFLAFRKDA
ncbi:class I SAM-dependent methyltransferase [Acidimangrovimonas sediminis]|uniref:class I SAM-dependent methyltransferase n=1 Tax=Acidimangrovimonas sediminis TaxID=2056283 RepID=UPI000C7FB1CE|nr:class I SAM-dependent methyltransferase [Acidimangrovimonas sediminis]